MEQSPRGQQIHIIYTYDAEMVLPCLTSQISDAKSASESESGGTNLYRSSPLRLNATSFLLYTTPPLSIRFHAVGPQRAGHLSLSLSLFPSITIKKIMSEKAPPEENPLTSTAWFKRKKNEKKMKERVAEWGRQRNQSTKGEQMQQAREGEGKGELHLCSKQRLFCRE